MRLQMEAHACRAASLEARLLVTLDTLDSIQASNAVELAGINQRNRELLASLDALSQSMREVEIQRDDLREAVLQLVAKGKSLSLPDEC